MPLFETIPIDIESVKEQVRIHWKGVEITKQIKVSQNHTYLTTRDDGTQFILRITPDPTNTRVKNVQLETDLLDYLDANHLPVCSTIKSDLTNSSVVVVQSPIPTSSTTTSTTNQDNTNNTQQIILCLFKYSAGEPIVYQDWKWMETKEIVIGLGKWFAQLHQLTKRFRKERGDDYLIKDGYLRHWQSLHDGVLKDVIVDTRDSDLANDSTQFGVIHGDVNPSNYFWSSELGMPIMFDWDQLQLSWFTYDLSAPIWGVRMLELTGSPIDRKPVPSANSTQYRDWLLEGYNQYNSTNPTDTITVIDLDQLERMITIRRQLYYLFCNRALTELEPSHPMYNFCKYIVDTLPSA